MADMLEWDDLKLVLAVARARSVTQAAKQTGLHHSTLFRRMADIETRLGVKLFERQQGDYQPTSSGRLRLKRPKNSKMKWRSLPANLQGKTSAHPVSCV
mgnify:CR=1 FL=1